MFLWGSWGFYVLWRLILSICNHVCSVTALTLPPVKTAKLLNIWVLLFMLFSLTTLLLVLVSWMLQFFTIVFFLIQISFMHLYTPYCFLVLLLGTLTIVYLCSSSFPFFSTTHVWPKESKWLNWLHKSVTLSEKCRSLFGNTSCSFGRHLEIKLVE